MVVPKSVALIAVQLPSALSVSPATRGLLLNLKSDNFTDANGADTCIHLFTAPEASKTIAVAVVTSISFELLDVYAEQRPVPFALTT